VTPFVHTHTHRLGNLRASLQCLYEAGAAAGEGGEAAANMAVTHLNICAVLSKIKK
jgi:hypothetical protein